MTIKNRIDCAHALGSDIQIDGVGLLEIPDGEKPAWILRFPFDFEPIGEPGEQAVAGFQDEQEDAA